MPLGIVIYILITIGFLYAAFHFRFKAGRVLDSTATKRATSRLPYRCIAPSEIRDFLNSRSFTHVLDVRSDEDFNEMSLRDFNNTSTCLICVTDQSFRKNVMEDSRLRDARDASDEILVVCNDGVLSEIACRGLLKLKFRPVLLLGGLQKVPREYMRYKARKVY